MKKPNLRPLVKPAFIALASVVLAACQSSAQVKPTSTLAPKKMDTLGTPVGADHHLGVGHHVGEIYLNGKACGGAGNPRGNSGSSTLCSMSLPYDWDPKLKAIVGWTPDLSAHIKWWVSNWKADLSGLQPDDKGHWCEAQVPIEPYGVSFASTNLHFFPNCVARVVVGIYGPKITDTSPDQTPPLQEVPVEAPPWESVGEIEAIKTHEGKVSSEDQAELAKYLAQEKAYFAFLERMWTQRGYTEAQRQKAMAEIEEEKRSQLLSGRVGFLLKFAKRAMDLDAPEAYKAIAVSGFGRWTLDRMNQHIADFMAAHGKHSLWSKP